MKRTVRGFTIVELMIVVGIIGILTTLGFVSFSSIQSNVRDSQRASRIKIITEALEKYYDKNGEYPSCTAMSQTPSTVVSSTLPGLDPSVLSTPSASNGTNSILPSCADLTTGTDGYAYVGDGSVACLTGSACLQYSLKYKEEGSGSVVSTVSRRTVSIAGAPTAPAAPTMSVVLSGDNHVIATINSVTCPNGNGTPYYGIDTRVNDGSWTGYSDWSSTVMTPPSPPIAGYGIKYSYRAQARCWASNYSYSTNSTGSEVSITRQIDFTPSAPTVDHSTPNWYQTSFFWGVVTCPTGTTPRYQYDYTVKIGSSPLIGDDGWLQTVNNNVAPYTTSHIGYTYMMDVRAQCYNNYGSGPWSSASHSEYTKPNPTINVLVVAGGGGGGGGKGGGGGGGGVVYVTSKSVGNQTYSLSVGGGGSSAGGGSNGGTGTNSVFDNIIALGGGGGGTAGVAGANGGSGGGGGGISSDSLGGTATQPGSASGGYGHNGGKGQNRSLGDSGGGGGGAGMIGGDAYGAGGNGKMTGGDGVTNIITGMMYGGGGGGGSCCYSGGGGGGGGGHGGEDGNTNPTAGAANTGGGGGGSGPNQSNSGAGGSGIIIVTYDGTAMAATFTGGTASSNGNTMIITYSTVGSGSFTVSG